jgi:hypothetical protein
MDAFSNFKPRTQDDINIYNHMCASIQYLTLDILEDSAAELRLTLEIYLKMVRDQELTIQEIQSIPTNNTNGEPSTLELLNYLNNKKFTFKQPQNIFVQYEDENNEVVEKKITPKILYDIGCAGHHTHKNIYFSKQNIKAAINYLRRELWNRYKNKKLTESANLTPSYAPKIGIYEVTARYNILFPDDSNLSVYYGQNNRDDFLKYKKYLIAAKYEYPNEQNIEKIRLILDYYVRLREGKIVLINSIWRPEASFWLVEYEFYDDVYFINEKNLQILFHEKKKIDGKAIYNLCYNLSKNIYYLSKNNDIKIFLRFLNINSLILAKKILDNDKNEINFYPIIIEFIYPKLIASPENSAIQGTMINPTNKEYASFFGLKQFDDEIKNFEGFDKKEYAYYAEKDFLNLFKPPEFDDQNLTNFEDKNWDKFTVYQLGIIFYYLTIVTLDRVKNFEGTLKSLKEKNTKTVKKYQHHFSEEWLNLLENMTKNNPEERIDIEKVCLNIIDLLPKD